MENVY